MITPDVFPDRGGPTSSVARSGLVNRQVPSFVVPRGTPPPARAQSDRIALSGSGSDGIAGLARVEREALTAASIPQTTATTTPAATSVAAVLPPSQRVISHIATPIAISPTGPYFPVRRGSR
jgi:hypothetical protein